MNRNRTIRIKYNDTKNTLVTEPMSDVRLIKWLQNHPGSCILEISVHENITLEEAKVLYPDLFK